MRFSAAAVSVVLALALAACGSGTTTTVRSSPAASSTAAGTTTTAAPQGSTTTSTTSASTTTNTVAGPRACVASELKLSFLGQQGATGHGLLGFALRNNSARSCKTFGYPGVLFLGRAGQALPTDATRTTHDFFGPAPEVKLVLAPGQSVSFRLGVLHGVVPNEPCATAYALQVIPPDDTAALRAPIADGAFECKAATVSPLRPGTSAYP